MVDLLNNFLNLLKLFLAVESDFTKSLQLRMEGVKERKINGGAPTANQERDGRKELKQ
jgi:hypothetical protein